MFLKLFRFSSLNIADPTYLCDLQQKFFLNKTSVYFLINVYNFTYFSMKKILITGSGGVLGNSFKDKIFIKQNKNTLLYLNSKKCDLRNYTKH